MDPAPGKNGRPRLREPGVRQQFMLAPEIVERVDELAKVMHIPKQSVVTLAITRMYEQEVRANGKEQK